MMSALPPPDRRSPLPCVNCAAPLAFDQRYCVECGTRRWGLPAPIAELIGRMLEQGGDAPGAPGTLAGTPRRLAGRPRTLARSRRARGARPRGAVAARPGGAPPLARRGRPVFAAPHPQSAAIAVMAMLGFGVILGDVSGAGTFTLAGQRAPLSVTVAGGFGTHHTVPSAATFDSGGGGGGGGAAPAAASSSTGSTSAVSAPASVPASTGIANIPGPLVLPPVKHVFLIVLSNQGFAQTFGGDRYLSQKLVKQGELLPNYYGVAGSSLANEIAMISGQGPTVQTEAECPVYEPVTTTSRATDGQLVGDGCVYPKTAHTLADELTRKHGRWHVYVDGQPRGPVARAIPCGAPPMGSADPYPPNAGGAAYAIAPITYVTSHNPFLYFQALQKTCRKTVVPLTALTRDLKRESTTPALSYIVPSPCENGDDEPCRMGAKAGLTTADRFLRRTLAVIKRSPAYKDSGLIAITFDHAPQTGPHADQSACCTTPPYPNLPVPSTTPTGTTTTPAGTTTTPSGATTTPGATTTTPTGTATTPTTPTSTTPGTTTTPIPLGNGETTPTGGGGQVGLLLLSRYVKPGASDSVDYFNHFSLLAGIESLFKLKLLGFAGDLSLPRFQPTLFDYHKP